METNEMVVTAIKSKISKNTTLISKHLESGSSQGRIGQLVRANSSLTIYALLHISL